MGRTSRRSDSTKSEKSERSEKSDKSEYVKEKRVSFVKTQLIHEKLTNHLMNKLIIENFLMFWINFYRAVAVDTIIVHIVQAKQSKCLKTCLGVCL